MNQHVICPSVKASFGLKIVCSKTLQHRSWLVFYCVMELLAVLVFCWLSVVFCKSHCFAESVSVPVEIQMAICASNYPIEHMNCLLECVQKCLFIIYFKFVQFIFFKKLIIFLKGLYKTYQAPIFRGLSLLILQVYVGKPVSNEPTNPQKIAIMQCVV